MLEEGWSVTAKKLEADLINSNKEINKNLLVHYDTFNEDEVVILMQIPSKE